MTLDLYTLHSTPVEGEFIIQKFDSDYNIQSVYTCTLTTCACPQGHKPRCRHRTMLGMFLAHGHIGDGWFLEWNTRMWRRPVGDLIDIGKGLEQASMIADETVMGTSTSTAEDTEPSPAVLGPEAPASPPSPPEGEQPPQAAEAAPARPVGVGALVKRRKIP
jgi:hypothetical protein